MSNFEVCPSPVKNRLAVVGFPKKFDLAVISFGLTVVRYEELGSQDVVWMTSGWKLKLGETISSKRLLSSMASVCLSRSVRSGPRSVQQNVVRKVCTSSVGV